MRKNTWKVRFVPRSETIIVAIISASAALIGAFGSSAISLLASKEILKQNEIQNCVQRLDRQEETLRAKGDAMLMSIASITTYAYSSLRNDAGWAERSEKLMENAFMIAVYAPEISVETLNVSGLMRQTLITHGADEVRIYNELTVAAKSWPAFYFRIMNKVRSERELCLKPELKGQPARKPEAPKPSSAPE